MEPPSLNEILNIKDTPESDDSWMHGIVKRSGEHGDGRIWALVWYNDVSTSHVGMVVWCETHWQFTERRFETLHDAWKSAIESMIARSLRKDMPAQSISA
jgi:hypothetical protein